MAIVRNLATVKTTADVTSSATSIPVNRTSVFSASQNPLDNPFYVTIMPASGDEPANLTNSEIALVTGISGTNLIVTRGQRSTTARAFSAGAIVTMGIYAEDAVLLGEVGTAVNPQPWVRPADIVWSELIDKIYPVGSIYMSATLSTPAAVETALGGTWEAWGAGRVPVGVDTTQTEFNTVGKTGGEKTHTLTIDEMPRHQHQAGYTGSGTAQKIYGWYGTSGSAMAYESLATGGSQAHNNLQPYITCYMYKRTA